MNSITADEALIARLRGIVEPVEIRDESGKVIGQFTPARSVDEQDAYERARKLFDLEKAKHVAEAERGQGRTTAEILRRLQSAGQEP